MLFGNPNAPGGWIINKAAFSIPASGQGDLGRNALRGFGATQIDFSLRLSFALSERVRLQASADMFNIFNHPNFGSPAARAAASIRCTRSAGRARCNWH